MRCDVRLFHYHGAILLYVSMQQASGVDTGWMLPPEHHDLCSAFRQSSFDSSVFFAVSEVSNSRSVRTSYYLVPSFVGYSLYFTKNSRRVYGWSGSRIHICLGRSLHRDQCSSYEHIELGALWNTLVVIPADAKVIFPRAWYAG